MTTFNPRFRLRNASGHSLHLRELLWDGQYRPTGQPADMLTLDPIDTSIYHTAMNDFATATPPANRDTSPSDAGATLFTFLDVADRLFVRISAALGRVGLSYAKYEVLKHLYDSGESVSLGALAEEQHCARSNITQLVDRLEAEGMVHRVDDPGDRRAVRAELTPAGEALVLEGTTQMDLVRAHFAASFTAPERVELARLLAKVV